MKRIVRFSPGECAPDPAAVLAAEGMSGPAPASNQTAALVEQAQGLFMKLAAPAGIYADISPAEFGTVFTGEGRNDPNAVLAAIYPRAKRLALFACTVGAELTEEIRRRFERHDYAQAYVLDAVASCAAERLADLVQDAYSEGVRSHSSGIPHSAICNLQSDFVLRYSPGYCGWHVSGQKRLFAFLGPGEIGITLRESFLMEPLKSVSGVFVLGPKDIHRFEPRFSFCSECRNPSCRERIARLDTADERKS